MDRFGCDYVCRTVGECIDKYTIPNDWCAEFYAYDDVYPTICIPVYQIRKTPAIMALKLIVVENQDEEYAGCMVFAKKASVAFKIDFMHNLIKAMQALEKE